MSSVCRTLFNPPVSLLVLMAGGLGALAFALTMQFGFGVAPCELCLFQRVPFGAVAALALIGLLARPYGRHTRFLLWACVLFMLANAGLALFHSGIERQWWEWHSACTGSVLSRTNSIDDLRRELLDKPVVRCDQISWTIFGLSMANLNIAYSLLLAFFAASATAGRKSA